MPSAGPRPDNKLKPGAIIVPEAVLLPATSLALDVSVLSVLVVLLRHRWLIISMTILFFVIFAGANYVPEKTYTSSVMFSPRARPAATGASSLLAQFGLGSAPYTERDHLPDLVKSREVLGAVGDYRYEFRTDTGIVRGTIPEIFGIRGREPDVMRYWGYVILNSRVRITTPGTYLIKVFVESPYRALAPMIASRLAVELNRANLESRKRGASLEREFVQAQLLEAGTRLRLAEDDLQRFETANRSFAATSFLAFEWDRLKRQVSMRQNLYTSLATALDNARIEEVRDLPVLTVVERPEIPLHADPPKWPEKALMGALFGFLLGIVLSFFHGYFIRKNYRVPAEAEEFRWLRGAFGRDLSKLAAPVERLFTGLKPGVRLP